MLKGKEKHPEQVLTTSSIPTSLPTSEPAISNPKQTVLSACPDNSMVSQVLLLVVNLLAVIVISFNHFSQ